LFTNSIIIVINYIQDILLLSSSDQFRFNNQIINKGNSLILATNQKEKLFCGENVETILGYTVDQVMGLGYWKLTEDTEFWKVPHKVPSGWDVYQKKLNVKWHPINSYNGTIKDFLKT
jgi:hypothetical protein